MNSRMNTIFSRVLLLELGYSFLEVFAIPPSPSLFSCFASRKELHSGAMEVHVPLLQLMGHPIIPQLDVKKQKNL